MYVRTPLLLLLLVNSVVVVRTTPEIIADDDNNLILSVGNAKVCVSSDGDKKCISAETNDDSILKPLADRLESLIGGLREEFDKLSNSTSILVTQRVAKKTGKLEGTEKQVIQIGSMKSHDVVHVDLSVQGCLDTSVSAGIHATITANVPNTLASSSSSSWPKNQYSVKAFVMTANGEVRWQTPVFLSDISGGRIRLALSIDSLDTTCTSYTMITTSTLGDLATNTGAGVDDSPANVIEVQSLGQNTYSQEEIDVKFNSITAFPAAKIQSKDECLPSVQGKAAIADSVDGAKVFYICDGKQWVEMATASPGSTMNSPLSSCDALPQYISSRGYHYIQASSSVVLKYCQRDFNQTENKDHMIDYGGDGSSPDAAARNCESIKLYFPVLKPGLHYVIHNGKPVHTYCDADGAKGDGRSKERAAESCEAILQFYPENKNTGEVLKWVGDKQRYCVFQNDKATSIPRGLNSDDAGTSCKDMAAKYGDLATTPMKTGMYYVKGFSKPVYCMVEKCNVLQSKTANAYNPIPGCPSNNFVGLHVFFGNSAEDAAPSCAALFAFANDDEDYLFKFVQGKTKRQICVRGGGSRDASPKVPFYIDLKAFDTFSTSVVDPASKSTWGLIRVSGMTDENVTAWNFLKRGYMQTNDDIPIDETLTTAYWWKPVTIPTMPYRTLFRSYPSDHLAILLQGTTKLGYYSNQHHLFSDSGYVYPMDEWSFLIATHNGPKDTGITKFYVGGKDSAPKFVGQSKGTSATYKFWRIGLDSQPPGYVHRAMAFDSVMNEDQMLEVWSDTNPFKAQ
eukprot:m.57606 g.57606  ORF g.57606 m.57606 type:complete len:794 (-) comp11119_c0_seq1:170-2551(-)